MLARAREKELINLPEYLNKNNKTPHWEKEGAYDYRSSEPGQDVWSHVSHAFTQFINEDDPATTKCLMFLNYTYYEGGDCNRYCSGEKAFFFYNNADLIARIVERCKKAGLEVSSGSSQDKDFYSQTNKVLNWSDEYHRKQTGKADSSRWRKNRYYAYDSCFYVSIGYATYPGTYGGYMEAFIRFMNLLDEMIHIGRDVLADIYDTLRVRYYYLEGFKHLCSKGRFEDVLFYANSMGDKTLWELAELHQANQRLKNAVQCYAGISLAYPDYSKVAQAGTEAVMQCLKKHGEGQGTLTEKEVDEYSTLIFKFGLWEVKSSLHDPVAFHVLLRDAKARQSTHLLFLLGQYFERLEKYDKALACYQDISRENPFFRQANMKAANIVRKLLSAPHSDLEDHTWKRKLFIHQLRASDKSEADFERLARYYFCHFYPGGIEEKSLDMKVPSLAEIDETEFSLISSIANLDGHESRLLAIAAIGELNEQVRDLKLKLREYEAGNKMTFFAGSSEKTKSSSDETIGVNLRK